MPQPDDILADFDKAKKMLNDKNRTPDRFGDDVDQMDFWVNMATIQNKELKKALKKKAVK